MSDERPMLAPTPEQKAEYLRQQEGPTVALDAETPDELERCTRTHVDPDSQHLLDIIDRLQARAERYEKALREADACLRDSHDHARPVHGEDRRWAGVRSALSDSTTGDPDAD